MVRRCIPWLVMVGVLAGCGGAQQGSLVRDIDAHPPLPARNTPAPNGQTPGNHDRGTPADSRNAVQQAAPPALMADGRVGLLYLSQTGKAQFYEQQPDGILKRIALDRTFAIAGAFAHHGGGAGALLGFAEVPRYLLVGYRNKQALALQGPAWRIVDQTDVPVGNYVGVFVGDARHGVHAVTGDQLLTYRGGWSRKPLGVRCASRARLAFAPGSTTPQVACWGGSGRGGWVLRWIGPNGEIEQVTTRQGPMDDSTLAFMVDSTGRPHIFLPRPDGSDRVMDHARRTSSGWQVRTLARHPVATPCPPPGQLGDVCTRQATTSHPLAAVSRQGRIELVYADMLRRTEQRVIEPSNGYMTNHYDKKVRVTATLTHARVGEQGLTHKRTLAEGPAPLYIPGAAATVDAKQRLHLSYVIEQRPHYRIFAPKP